MAGVPVRSARCLRGFARVFAVTEIEQCRERDRETARELVGSIQRYAEDAVFDIRDAAS